MIIYRFFIQQGLHKKYFKSFNWVGRSIVIIRQLASDSFDNKGTVKFVLFDQEHRVQSVFP